MNCDSFTTRRRWLGDYFYVGFISAFDTGSGDRWLVYWRRNAC